MKDIVWKLLRRNISVGQLAGYAVANLVGLVIVISSLQLYHDITSATSADGGDGMISDDYLIISKRVEGFGSLLNGNNVADFSPEEIAELEAQPWAKKVGEFTSADFNVYAGLDFGGRSLSTALFLESVPDEYFDVRPSGWSFNPERDNIVPIIISKDYLALYNFGFAPSRGMPQISESMIGMVPLRLAVSGRGESRVFNGRIVGFSSRLNTIAVPDEFMSWANDRFGDSAGQNPSRLIVRTDGQGNPQAERFMADHDYEIAGDKAGAGRAAYIMRVITTVVVAIGAVISLLALVILLLSISLLVQKNRDKISTLLSLGYLPRTVAGYYIRIVAAVNTVVLLAAAGIMLIGRHFWMVAVSTVGSSDGSVALSLLSGFGVMGAVTIVNILYICRATRRLF